MESEPPSIDGRHLHRFPQRPIGKGTRGSGVLTFATEVERALKNGEESRIGGINDTPADIGFLGYLYARLPKKKIRERMDHFKDQAKQLIEIRKSGHSHGKKIRRAKRGKKLAKG